MRPAPPLAYKIEKSSSQAILKRYRPYRACKEALWRACTGPQTTESPYHAVRTILKSGFLDKLIERLDRMDPGSLQTHFLRLAKEKGFMETVFHAIQEGIIVLDSKSHVTYANRAAETMFGFSLESAIHKPLSRYLKGLEWERLLNLDENEWSKLVSREIEITYPKHRFITFYVVPLTPKEQELEGAVIILRDITREREAEAHTLESERLNALTLLAAGVAHEIGNPLNSLTIHLQLLERELSMLPDTLRENFKELIHVSKKEVTRLDQIIHQFLKAIRPTLPKFQKTFLRQILQDTVDFLKHEIEDRHVLIEIDELDEIPAIPVDRGQIKQAFFNIIKNAVHAMPDGGILKISLFSTDKFVAVSFKDSGSGISSEEISSIFEPYHTTKPDGSGLGLMIVQRIVRDHSGEIEVDSEPGIGTTFSLFLPRDARRIRLLKAPS